MRKQKIDIFILKRHLAALSFWSTNDKHAMLCNMRQTKENHTVPHLSIQTDNINYTNICGFWRSYWWQLLFKWSAEYYYGRQSKCVASVMDITHFWKRLLSSFLTTYVRLFWTGRRRASWWRYWSGRKKRLLSIKVPLLCTYVRIIIIIISENKI